MPGSCDRSRKAAVARSISPSYDSALTGFFGTRQPSRNEAEGSHAAYIAALRKLFNDNKDRFGFGDRELVVS